MLDLMLEELGKTRNCSGDYYYVLKKAWMLLCFPIGPEEHTDCDWKVKEVSFPILGKRCQGQIYSSAPQARSLNSVQGWCLGGSVS